jgi:GNAT superfamily N-acetyltransferase
MNIRFADIKDIDEIASLEEQFSKQYSKGRPDIFYDEESSLYYELIKICFEDQNKKILVAEENKKIVGYCIFHIKITEDHPTVYDRKVMFIEVLYVKDEFRKKGIGKMFFNKIKEIANENDIMSIELWAWEFNQNAIEFYEHLGMKTKVRIMELEIE